MYFHAEKMKFQLRQASQLIHHGGIIAYPTEAVYGLGCDPFNMDAVKRLLEIKQRPMHKGLILIASHVEQLKPFIEWQAESMDRVRTSWPGPYTWLLPAKTDLPPWIHGDRATVACRVTAHPLAAGLCHAANSALISTSANQTGQQPAKSALQVRLRCPEVDRILHGELGGLKKPTRIRDALTGVYIR